MVSEGAPERAANRVGIVGAGAMGLAFTKGLIRAGYEIRAFDVSEAALHAAASEGAEMARSARAVAEETELVITVLPRAEDVEEALFGNEGIAQGVGQRTVIIEASTIDPRSLRALAARVEEYGARLVDAGISASPGMAAEGRGAILLGGERDTFERCEPVLSALFRNGRVMFVGALGLGKVVKLVSNMVGAVQMIAIAEGFDVGLRAGVDPQVLYEGMGLGMAACWALRVRPPYPGLVPNSPADLDFAPDFPLDYMVKDLDYFASTAHGIGIAPLLAGTARELYGYASRSGLGAKDFAAISLLMGSFGDMVMGGSGQADAG